MRLCCDNIGGSYINANPMQHDHDKHIGTGYHFVLQQLVDGNLVVHHIPTKLRICFTKGAFGKGKIIFLKNDFPILPSLVKNEG